MKDKKLCGRMVIKEEDLKDTKAFQKYYDTQFKKFMEYCIMCGVSLEDMKKWCEECFNG